MKKLLCLLTALLLCLLPLCSAAGDGWIADAELSEEEWELKQLLHQDETWGPYEFKAPEGARYITLVCWEMKDGQWAEVVRVPRELTPPTERNKVTIIATQAADGSWTSSVRQSRAAEDLPDGRIFISTEDILNGMRFSIQQDEHFIPIPGGYRDNTFTSISWSREEELSTAGLYWMQRCFLNPESNRILQRIPAPLNETIPLEFYVGYREGHHPLPPISTYHDPVAFAAFDYAYAVTATFSAEPLPEGE